VAVLLFDFGAATTDQAQVLGQVISVFMLGMLPFTLFYVLLRGFYSLEDTRTPFFITVIFSLVFLGLLVPFFGQLSGGGVQITYIALCYSISYWVGLVIAWVVLARKLGGLSSLSTFGSIGRMLVVGILSVAVMLFTQNRLNELFFGDAGIVDYSEKTTLLIRLFLVVLSGAASYIVLSWLLRVPEITLAYRVFRDKLSPKVNS
jgi:putative peptidoglycan lipid II flippase